MLEVNFFPFPTLFTERLKLRRIVKEDVHRLYHIRSNEELMRYLARPVATKLDDARTLIDKIDNGLETNSGITWAISYRTDEQKLLGTIGYWRLEKENFRAEIGYILDKQEHGKSVMREAIQKVLEFGFSDLRLHSVEARVSPANEASVRLLEKVGFVKEGLFRENFFFNGAFIDSGVYTLLAANFNKPANP